MIHTAIRCAMLANRYRDVPAYQCPTGMTRVHYHGHDRQQPYNRIVDGRPCGHKHKSLQAAIACSNSRQTSIQHSSVQG